MVLTILNESRKTGIEAGIFLSLAMLTKPIAVVVIPLIIVLMIRVSYRKSGLKCSAAVLLSTYLIWSFRNYLATGYFGFSSQQSTNLHLYEGSGAVAISMNMPLEQVQQYEYSQIQEFLGSSPSLQQLTDYQMIRGMELILKYPLEFLQLHLIGIPKLLFGPGRGELYKFMSESNMNFQNMERLDIFFFFLTILSLFLGISALCALFLMNFKSSEQRVLVFLFLLFVIVSSGAQTYSRFRIPIVPLISIFAAFTIVDSFGRIKRIRNA
jgi:4-amino-4-deoxy-L-arabinose transferase-like glycosyltransferase